MLTKLIRFSIRHPTVILVLALGVLGYGIYATRIAKLDVFPEFAPPQVVLSSGAASEAHYSVLWQPAFATL